MGILDDYKAKRLLQSHGLDGSILDHARKSPLGLCTAIASADVAAATSSEAAAVHLVFAGEPDDFVRARAAVWNQRLRELLPGECE